VIIYDENLKISAITQNSLEVLGFDSLDDFLSHHSDLGELVITSQKNTNCSFLEFLQNANNNTARINIKRKDGSAILLNASLQCATLKNEEKIFAIILERQDTLNNQNLVAATKTKPILRLPIFEINARYLFDSDIQVLIDDTWFETSAKVLNLQKDELAYYLNIFSRNAREKFILIQSSLIAKDEMMLRKYVNEIKEAALNLKLNIFVKELENLLKSDRKEKRKEISMFSKRLSEIDIIVKKYSKKSVYEN